MTRHLNLPKTPKARRKTQSIASTSASPSGKSRQDLPSSPSTGSSMSPRPASDTSSKASTSLPDHDPIVISPMLFARLMHAVSTTRVEITGWGISLKEDQPFHLSEMRMVKQYNDVCHVRMDDQDNGRYVFEMVKAGVSLDCCQRVWIHTHPGPCSTPSSEDWATFKALSAEFPFFVMLIMGTTGIFTAHASRDGRPTRSPRVSVDWADLHDVPSIDWTPESWLRDMRSTMNIRSPSPISSGTRLHETLEAIKAEPEPDTSTTPFKDFMNLDAHPQSSFELPGRLAGLEDMTLLELYNLADTDELETIFYDLETAIFGESA